MTALAVVMILMNASGIMYILNGLANATAFSGILGVGNVLVSGYVIYLLAMWMCGDKENVDNIEKHLEWGLLVNVAQNTLQIIVMAIFVSQNGEAAAVSVKETTLESCELAN